ncbi:hypothetical protein Goari_015073, partial [Gossypium aridum]|nr:hypothetical protein [Gossypium aridum]
QLTCVLRRQIFNSNCKTSITLGKSQSKELEWIKKVEEKLAHAQHVEDKVSKGKYLFRSCLGKQLDESTQAMKEVHAEGHFPEILLVNDPSTIAVNLTTTKLVGTANVREEIYQSLMGDDVGMIGVWGMGRIGKTTIMKGVHNRLLKESKFRKLIWLTVSKELDILRLQKNIASQLERNFLDDEDTIIRAGKDVGILKPTSENGCKLVLTALLESIVRSM